MLIWTFLHITAMFLTFSMALGPDLVLHTVARRGLDVAVIRATFSAGNLTLMLLRILFLLGISLGFGAAAARGYDLLSFWLVGSYVLVAVMLVIGGGVGARWQRAVLRQALAAPEGLPPAALRAVLHDWRGLVAPATTVVGLLLVLLLMVFKPSGPGGV